MVYGVQWLILSAMERVWTIVICRLKFVGLLGSQDRVYGFNEIVVQRLQKVENRGNFYYVMNIYLNQ
jgi:hypothetical protein